MPNLIPASKAREVLGVGPHAVMSVTWREVTSPTTGEVFEVISFASEGRGVHYRPDLQTFGKVQEGVPVPIIYQRPTAEVAE